MPVCSRNANAAAPPAGWMVWWRGARAVVAGALLLSADAHAQTQAPAVWPAREVKIIIGFSAGGTTDIITRTLAPELTKQWGQPIVIENRTGAGGNIGADLVAKARPDLDRGMVRVPSGKGDADP